MRSGYKAEPYPTTGISIYDLIAGGRILYAGEDDSRGKIWYDRSMPEHAITAPIATVGPPQAAGLFPVDTEYARCVAALEHTGLLTRLTHSDSMGVVGIDGNEYPLPTQEQVGAIFAHNQELVGRKVAQGFDRLALTPLAMPTPRLIAQLEAALIHHAADGTIYRTRRAPADPAIPVRVNATKHVWIWEVVRQVLDTDALIYFPHEHVRNHGGLTKIAAIQAGRICAVPGWSVGLVESFPIMPPQGQGTTVGGRPQLEIGLSPREYLRALQTAPYEGETGRTLEDFLTRFLTHLETTGEVSQDVDDINALWCLGQYFKIPYAEVVPTGRWVRSVGRVRLDAHRTGNKLCAQSWGVATTVRLPRP